MERQDSTSKDGITKRPCKKDESVGVLDTAPPSSGPALVAWARREAATKEQRRVKAAEECSKLAPPQQVWVAAQHDTKNEEATCPALEASLGLKEIEGISK